MSKALRGRIALAAAVLLLFLCVIAARLPASWILSAAPKFNGQSPQCESVSGTIWLGACSGLAAGIYRFSSAKWELEALPLLRGTVAAHLALSGNDLKVDGLFQRRLNGAISATEVQASFSMPNALIPQLPGNLSGHVAANIAALAVDGFKLQYIAGRIDVQGLTQTAPERMPLGSYQLEFPDSPTTDQPPVGTLRDTGGPLEVHGTLTLTPEPGYLLDGTVAPRPDASASLLQQIAVLGSPDAAGRRSFSQAATF